MRGLVSSPQALAPEKKAMRTIVEREVRKEGLGLRGGSKPPRMSPRDSSMPDASGCLTSMEECYSAPPLFSRSMAHQAYRPGRPLRRAPPPRTSRRRCPAGGHAVRGQLRVAMRAPSPKPLRLVASARTQAPVPSRAPRPLRSVAKTEPFGTASTAETASREVDWTSGSGTPENGGDRHEW